MHVYVLLTFIYYFLAVIENDLSNDTIEHLNLDSIPNDVKPIETVASISHRHEAVLDVVDENSPKIELLHSSNTHISESNKAHSETKTSNDDHSVISPVIDETKTRISTFIGPAESSLSLLSARHYKPMSFISTQTCIKTTKQQQHASSPNIQNVRTMICDDNSLQSRALSIRHEGKKDIVTTVRFLGTDQNGKNAKETYL